MKDGGAYGFVKENVIDPYGQRLLTNGDVYISKVDCDGPLADGLTLEFEILPDPRHSNRFKAVGAKAVRNLPVLAATPQELQVLSLCRVGYHDHAKAVPPEEVRKAVNNKPFQDAINMALEDTVLLESDEHVTAFILAYLRQKFPGLESVGITLNVDLAGQPVERQEVEDQIKNLKELGMTAQAASLTTTYELYVVTCEMLRECLSRGVPAPGMHLTMGMMNLLVGGFDTRDLRSRGNNGRLEDIQRQAELSISTIRFLRDNDLLRPGCVIPINCLPDILMAAPVWFIASEDEVPSGNWENSDPLPDEVNKYFSGLLGANQTWADLYLLWNRRTRTLARYEGDQMPPFIRKAVKVAKKWFDYVAIATPYHDLAGREWEDPNWQRQIDPFIYGFKKGLPFIYFLGRWSDSGIFPLMPEMIADTVAYLRACRSKLSNFGSPFWCFVGGPSRNRESHNQGPYLNQAGEHLVSLADGLIQAFEQGNLFDYIRGNGYYTQPAVN